ncbi:hypothetical protein JL721_12032 [Aureococcus anophagefferens]|nr:hypothetical protein JL721_12032 [Aureococcus anophagefferens]
MEARPPTSRPAGGVIRGGHLDDGEERLALARRGRRPARRDPLRYVFESSVHVKRMEARPPTSRPAGGVIRGGHLDDGEERLALARRGRRPARRDPLRYVFESSVHVKRMEARPPTSRPAGGDPRRAPRRRRRATRARGAAAARADPLRYVFESSVHAKRMEARPPTSRPAGGVIRGRHLDAAKSDSRRGGQRQRADPLRYVFESSVHVKRMEARPPTSRPAGGVVRGEHLDDGEERLGGRRRRAGPAPLRRAREAVADKAEAEVEKAALKAELEEAVADKTEAQGSVTTLEAENAALEAENAELKAAKAPGGRPTPAPSPSPSVSPTPAPSTTPTVSPAPTVAPTWGVVEWIQRGDDIDGEAAYDYSGRSVSLSADGATLAVGRPERGAGSDAGPRACSRGTVDETWKQRGDDIDGEAADDYSGYSVSLSADGGAGRQGVGNDGAAPARAARVFAWDSDDETWVQRGDDIDGEAADDWSGYSVSLSADGTTLATWKQRGGDIDGEAADDWSGWSVSLSADGTMLAVGAWGNDPDNFLPDAGHARVFAWDSGTWVKRGDDIDGEAAYDWSGYSVSLSADGTALAVGASGNDGAGSYAGHARVFAWDPVDETWVQRGDDIDGEAAYDESGISVSLSADGTTLAVGAHYNDGAGSDAGHARVFAWDSVDETWVQRGDDVDGEAADDFSGYSVSLSADGTTLAVGAPYNDGGGTDAGHARVYSSWGVVEWIQRGDDIDGEAAYDYSGRSVSLSADGATLAVGASGNDGAGSDAGHARVFAWDPVDETWKQRGDDIDGEAADDYSGYSVSLSADGTALAVGASGNDGAGSRAGHARVFAWDSDDETWVQRGDDIDGEAADDWSGYSVSLSADGTTLAVGAVYNDGAGSNAGHARVFAWDPVDETWKQRGGDIDGEAADDWSGWSVSLSADGTMLAVGAWGNDPDNFLPDAGHARVFAWDSGTWVKRGDDIDGEAADDWSGYSVSLSADGTALAVGASGNDGAGSYAGHARVFAWDPVDETWKQRGDDIDGEAAYDESGISVSLSADGTTLAVGAHYNDGAGSDAGHARVFAWDSVDETWVQRGDDVDGEAADDFSGYSVSLSADGTTLAVGAPYNDGGGTDAGHARVYSISL